VFDDAFAHGEGQVEATKGGVALFKPGDDTQSVEIVVEGEAVGAEGAVESFFSGVAEGRVANVVRQRQRFSEFMIESERGGQGAGDLGDFEGVRKAATEVVGWRAGARAGEDLGLAGEAAEGAGVEDARRVAGEWGAVGMKWFKMRALRERRVSGARDGDLWR
jgi:hypothetical protein